MRTVYAKDYFQYKNRGTSVPGNISTREHRTIGSGNIGTGEHRNPFLVLYYLVYIVKDGIGPLTDEDGNVISDNKDMAQVLNTIQYSFISAQHMQCPCKVMTL